MTLKFPDELIINGTEWTYTPFRFNIDWINLSTYTPQYRDVTVTGISPLNLPNAEVNGLRYIKLFGKCEQTPNLFDADKATLNYYINSSGEEQYNASWSCSDYIEVKEGCVYNLSGVSSYGSSPRTGFYAVDKSFVSARSQSSANFTIPDGVKYMRVSVYKANLDTAAVKQVMTFDKYIIVGSPTFNGDVVSGFSSSNYITVGTFQPLSNTWEIAGKFNAQSAGATQIVFARTKSTYFGIRMMISQAAKISLEASSNGTSNMVSVTSDATISYSTDYWFRVKFNGTQYIVDLSTDNSTWTNYITVDESTTIYDDSSNLLQIGAKGNQYFRGSIDLKEFKITINNTTTSFTGNKIPILCNNGIVGSTGYTVVGSPTISSDLVVSGFNASNYLSFQQFVTYTNSFEIVFPEFIFDTYTHNEQFFITINNSKFWLRGWKSGGLRLVLSDSNGNIFVETDMVTGLTTGVKYATKLTYNNGVYNFYIKGGSYADWTSTWNLTSDTKAYFVGTLRIGQRTDFPNTYFEGSCDLKTFKMTFDGIPVRLPELVQIFGKNLFDQSQLLNATDWSLNSDGYYNGLFSNYNAKFTNGFEIDVPFKEKTVYTLSCKGYVSDEGSRARFVFVYTDETSKSLTIDGTSSAEYTLTTTSTKTLAKIRGTYASGASSTLYLKDIQLEEGSSATAFQSYHASPTAVAQDLLSCGDYVDEQNVTTGEITRKVGYKIFNGTETWNTYSGTPASGYAYIVVNDHLQENTYLPFCTHFNAVRGNVAVSSMKIGDFKCLSGGDTLFFISEYSTLEGWKNYLATQYSAGTPVIVVYPTTSTTETVAAQNTLQNVEGLNTLYITQSAIDGLAMEITYSAGVEVTIEEVQAANVDQTVEVTIGE